MPLETANPKHRSFREAALDFANGRRSILAVTPISNIGSEYSSVLAKLIRLILMKRRKARQASESLPAEKPVILHLKSRGLAAFKCFLPKAVVPSDCLLLTLRLQ